MVAAKRAFKLLAASFLLSFLVLFLLGLSGLGYVIALIPPFFWLGALIAPEGGPAAVGATVWIASFTLSLLVVSLGFWISYKRTQRA